MVSPTAQDMQTSLDDARFFYQLMEPVVRGPEHQQDIQIIRRYFRAYLHCWKCVPDFVREILRMAGPSNSKAWITWCGKWNSRLSQVEAEAFECLRNTRDHDTHWGTISLNPELAAGLFPLVMFQPGKQSGPRRELLPCCELGINVAERLIREYASV
jgi:hypothetical protein